MLQKDTIVSSGGNDQIKNGAKNKKVSIIITGTYYRKTWLGIAKELRGRAEKL